MVHVHHCKILGLL